MGITVSNIARDIKKETNNILELEGSKNVCRSSFDGIEFRGLRNVNIGLITIKQNCTVDSKTYFNAMLKALTKMASKLDAKTLGGFGISVSNLSESIEDKVNNIVRLKCGGSVSDIQVGKIQIIDSYDSNFDGFIIDLSADVKGECSIDAVIDAISETVVETKTETAGWTFGIGEIITLAIIAVIAIAGLGFLTKAIMGDNKEDQYRQSHYPSMQQQHYQPPPQPYF